jgi:hypothetical protein
MYIDLRESRLRIEAQQSPLGIHEFQGLQYVHSWRDDKDDKRAQNVLGTSNSLFKFIR